MQGRQILLVLWALTISGGVGCRCCPGLDRYATAIDVLKEYPLIWDSYYCPQWDISRAGHPDWCGPVNRRLAPCRCDCRGSWKRYDEIWRYPPRTPYEFPNDSYPGPSQFRDQAVLRDETGADVTLPESPGLKPPPLPVSEE